MTDEFVGLETYLSNKQESDTEPVPLTVETLVDMWRELQERAKDIPLITEYYVPVRDVMGLPEGTWAYVYRDEFGCPVFVRQRDNALMEVFTKYDDKHNKFVVKEIKLKWA